MTPEGKVKQQIDDILDYFGVMYDKPVLTAYGRRQLDYVCCYLGRYITIETKAPGKEPTGRQRELMVRVCNAGGSVFVISEEAGYVALCAFLQRVLLRTKYAKIRTDNFDRVQFIGPVSGDNTKSIPRVRFRRVEQYCRTAWASGNVYPSGLRS